MVAAVEAMVTEAIRAADTETEAVVVSIAAQAVIHDDSKDHNSSPNTIETESTAQLLK